MYGAEPGKSSFANCCLLARRLVERGVRFVQIFHEAWDQHGNLVNDLKKNCRDTDRPAAALIKDLKQRGLLEDTLVIWGGEFGRTPMVQGGNDGRDHHPNAFTMWLAGGGVKPGITLGETDELGFNVVRDRVHVHDLHATLLHLLGFDHEKLTYRFQGRDFRLTDVVVAPNRLGAINQVRLVVEALGPRGRDARIALMAPPRRDRVSRTNLELLREYLGDRRVLEIPRFPRPDAPVADAGLAAELDRWLGGPARESDRGQRG
jgi:hypothetical protein